MIENPSEDHGESAERVQKAPLIFSTPETPPQNPVAKAAREMAESAERQVELGKAYLWSVMSWMKTLATPEVPPSAPDKKPLPYEYRLGAAFPGALLLTVLLGGCAPKEIVECSEDEERMGEKAMAWLNEHPEEIQAKMDELWPDQNITAKEILGVLNNAKIECSGEIPEEKSNIAEAHWPYNERITIFVDQENFEGTLDLFIAGEWTQDYSLDDLVQMYDPESGYYDPVLDLSSYHNAMVIYTTTLLHEAAHIALRQRHANGVDEESIRIAEGGGTPYNQAQKKAELDEVYAWGSAAAMVGLEEIEAMLQPFWDKQTE